MPRVATVGWPQETNVELAAAWRELGIDAALLEPSAAAALLGPGAWGAQTRSSCM
jgi:hypothetical protein